jgi:hypothetical protein
MYGPDGSAFDIVVWKVEACSGAYVSGQLLYDDVYPKPCELRLTSHISQAHEHPDTFT